ncbi:MAG: hypothetical protein K8R88_00045 [Armatimonadetes bacterium]|nr:hypothetical protein [Armatimonadota bacterium]
MMLANMLAITVLQDAVVPGVRLTFDRGIFTAGAEQVRISEKSAKAADVFALKDGKTWIVWDKRGLTVRVGKNTRTTRFADYPVSSKILTKDQITESVALFKSGERTKEAASLAGSEFVGNKLYLVPRWQDRTGKGWLETLVVIDLADKEPWPKLVGKVNGVSRATGQVDDQLFRQGEDLFLLAENADTWGFARWNLKENFGQYTQMGERLLRVSIKPELGGAAFVESTTYGMEKAGTIELADLRRNDLGESRGSIRFVQFKDPFYSVTVSNGVLLRQGLTGQEMKFAPGTAFASTKSGILAWSPAEAPKQAILYDSNDMKVLATWKVGKP